MYSEKEQLREHAQWDGAEGESRYVLLGMLQGEHHGDRLVIITNFIIDKINV